MQSQTEIEENARLISRITTLTNVHSFSVSMPSDARVKQSRNFCYQLPVTPPKTAPQNVLVDCAMANIIDFSIQTGKKHQNQKKLSEIVASMCEALAQQDKNSDIPIQVYNPGFPSRTRIQLQVIHVIFFGTDAKRHNCYVILENDSTFHTSSTSLQTK